MLPAFPVCWKCSLLHEKLQCFEYCCAAENEVKLVASLFLVCSFLTLLILEVHVCGMTFLHETSGMVNDKHMMQSSY